MLPSTLRLAKSRHHDPTVGDPSWDSFEREPAEAPAQESQSSRLPL